VREERVYKFSLPPSVRLHGLLDTFFPRQWQQDMQMGLHIRLHALLDFSLIHSVRLGLSEILGRVIQVFKIATQNCTQNF
jgi:hypothetical protein